MAELDRLDSRIAAAVRAIADRAETEVDAVAVATRAARGRRTGALGWFERTVPVPVSVLLLLALLALLAMSLAAGGWGPFRTATAPMAPSPSASGPASPSPSPAGEPGTGSVSVIGTESVLVDTQYTSSIVGGVTQLRGGVVRVTTTATDPRATGTGTFAFSADIVGDVGPEWGTYRLATAGGTWEGSCSGSAWDGGSVANGACWLVGSGAFAGYTYYRSYSWGAGRASVAGIIFPGLPPQP